MARQRSGVEFCCCAIPLVNVGAYALILEWFLVSLCIIVLALAPPEIVAADGSLPSSWPKIVFALLGVALLLLQPLGLFAVLRKRTTLYRTYLRIATIVALATLLVVLAFFAVAAARHSTALASCIVNYANTPQGDGQGISTTQTESIVDVGDNICDIWIWVQVGCMGLLIALIGITQLYMLFCQRAYGGLQRQAVHEEKALSGAAHDEIPLSARDSTLWSNARSPDDEGVYDSSRPAPGTVYADPHSQDAPYGRAYAQEQYGEAPMHGSYDEAAYRDEAGYNAAPYDRNAAPAGAHAGHADQYYRA